jgi:nitrogen fixation/metabolism regulation signal transduction histidine kinase
MTLQESGLTDSRLLARLVQASVLVFDEQGRVAFASPGACQLLGATSEAQLLERWDDIARELRSDEWRSSPPQAAPYRARADVSTPRGPRAIRFEVHEVARARGVQRIMLLRTRDELLPSDRALLLASEAQANRHALTGLVHAAKGPLNNFTLTLALLAAGIERSAGGAALDDALRVKWMRYVDVLRNETARLAATLDEIHSLATPQAPSRESIDIGTMLRDIERVLHHDAALREIDLDVDAAGAPVPIRGDPQLVRLALLVFTICLLDLSPANARVALRVNGGVKDTHVASITITTSHATLPADLVASLFRLTCTAESPYSAAIAGRLIVEAEGGDVALLDHDEGAVGFLLQFPRDTR